MGWKSKPAYRCCSKKIYNISSMISRFHKYFLIILGLLGLASIANAQLTAPSSSTGAMTPPTLTSSLPDKTSPTLSPEAMIFDGAVDPHEYRLGPGDVFQ